MIDIQNINPIQKGSLLATCDVHIKPWHMTLHEVKIFEKGANRWIGMPSKEFTTPEGEKKYTDLVTFDNENVKNRFRSQIMGAIDKFLEANPEMTPEDVVKEADDLPF
jgi:DNA-binding cell septation regulator SpoVG